jgi:hypothetical protein
MWTSLDRVRENIKTSAEYGVDCYKLERNCMQMDVYTHIYAQNFGRETIREGITLQTQV